MSNVKLIMADIFRKTLTKISPKLNTAIVYRVKLKRKWNENNPVTLNEKILWLKFHTYLNNELVKKCADKYRVREYLTEQDLKKYLVDLLGVYDRTEDIDWDRLPKKFVMKINVGCGFNYIVFDKDKENKEEVFLTLNKWLKKAPNSYLGYSEMQYKDVKPVIIIEKFLDFGKSALPEDYKFYCINGKVELVMACFGRDENGHNATYVYCSPDWEFVASDKKVNVNELVKPLMLDEAIQVAEKLAKPFPFVRVDLYLSDNAVYFGELTFTPAAGMDIDHLLKPVNCNEDIDHIYGRKLVLPKS